MPTSGDRAFVVRVTMMLDDLPFLLSALDTFLDSPSRTAPEGM
jgi:hypothetical protein